MSTLFSYHSATADVLKNYDNDPTSSTSSTSSPAGSPERVPLEMSDNERHLSLPLPTRIDSRISTFSADSTVNLLNPSAQDPDQSDSPFQWNLPVHSSPPQEKDMAKKRKKSGGAKRHWHGWRVIVLGSYLNILLVLLPISWALDYSMSNYHTLVFIFCILSMIPLVKLHDLATDELALRIGGSKTGLLNASMSNMVEIVIAITALRKCEIDVVQSSLIGSILSKLLLVLGMCFFAGGLRFSEQDFDATATQVHSSLLSISVGAVLLPAAYHFALSGGGVMSSDQQKRDILRMSHGVSIVLLFIYVAYLLFQLWSHTHLYKEKEQSSKRHSVKLPIDPRLRKQKPSRPQCSTDLRKWTSPVSSAGSSRPTTPMKTPYSTSPYSSMSQVTLTTDTVGVATPAPAANSTIRLIHVSGESGGVPLDRRVSFYDEGTEQVPEALLKSEESSPEPQPEAPKPREPELSWAMTLLLMTVVTIMVAVNAEWLVGSMDSISTTVSKEWIALILLPTVASIAELVTAVNTSVKDKLTLSVSVAVGSTIQTALFVIPFIVTLGWILDKPLALLFDPFESVVLYISVNTVGYVVADGKSNWLEGIILMCLYVIIAVSFWFYPGSNLASTLAVCTDT